MQTDDTAQSGKPPRAPLYAKIALLLFALSLVALTAAGWLWYHGGDDAFRRGYTPLTAEWQIKGAWIAHPIIGKMLRCDVSVSDTNELGRPFAYKAVRIEPGGGCFRDDGVNGEVFAVAVGDSFTFGHKVALEKAWTELLESSLKMDVVNMGLSGGSPSQALRIFEIYGAPLNPKVVIFTTFVNDWLDEACFQAWWAQRQVLGGQVDYPQSDAIYNAVRQNAYRLPDDWRQPPLGGSADCDIDGESYRFDGAAYAEQDTRSPTIDKGRRQSEKAIVELRNRANQIGARLIVVAIPAKEYVYHDRVIKIIPYAVDMPADTFCTMTADWCRKNGIECIDMLPVLRKRVAAGEKPYFPRDGHLREEGNAMLAEEVGRVLAADKLTSQK